jgi:hypothetical protein
MSKTEFIKNLNEHYTANRIDACINFMHSVTKLSISMCAKIIRNLWGCSAPKKFGTNVYNLLETTANDVEYMPLVRKDCSVYLIYPDEHAAAFALYKLKQK